MPELLNATFQIVTPMFIGDADHSPNDGIRPPSIKGALRFWWRALNWGRYLHEARDESKALQLLHQQEARLFGIAADGKETGQSLCLLRVTSNVRRLKKTQLPEAKSGHQYLLGLGLYHFKDKYLREARSTGEVQINVRFHPNTQPNERQSVAEALLMLGLLGGLGSRARKGFGALAIQMFDGADIKVPTNTNEMIAVLKKLTADRLDAMPPYTAFSMRSRIDLISETKRDAWQLLGEIGSNMQLYRSFGQNGKVGDKQAERNFIDDHDLGFQATHGDKVNTHPRRIVFGLPHNYFFSTDNSKADVNAITPKPGGGWSDIGANRRASPLFIHPHQFPDGSIAAVLALLPGQFLPDDWRIGIKGKGAVQQTPVNPDWSVLHQFMNRFPNRQTVLESRP
ncbi:type III-B CRISPR module RAMP protein Cmr1 [Thiospirillum jenense]|uniref:Type III-B CRISPR module RAMP protein Cmr1 n=1 Tax=Thiospirillum jenense TaxID=1653858 RepID=A0A839HCI2_9GAMM|nr:type III-B CRISPR module RAMP protein Cmr1 [Thiospirillum jenense]MBB1126675.1 type III-B CRISPR module RAMP protein Cmr1 [Thiospirillum jenense]